MKANPYKYLLPVLAVLFVVNTAFGQDISISVNSNSSSELNVKAKIKTKKLKSKMNAFGKSLEASLDNMTATLSNELDNLAPKITAAISNITSDINIEVNDSGDGDSYNNESTTGSNRRGGIKEKFKTYSKSYPIDGNDKIKLSNQYGKIMVNTWDRHEVKVDVQIKAQADDDGDAQKLLDGVQIKDSKEGDVVTFKTDIQRNNGGWSLWNFGGKKKHKVEINYTVYMPAKTDLSVENSYGGIQLPDLYGRVKISSSYGSILTQNLSNSANEIDCSYGSLKAGNINGVRLAFSYGSADIDECNNLKADLDYGSFKLGRLTGIGNFDLSYVGGFKIDEMANSFKKLNINSSYSGVTVGVPNGNNFDFDITTTYGGFSYNDDKVAITSKTPSDGKHENSTKNYKGHFGRSGSESQINIHTSYGGVNFE